MTGFIFVLAYYITISIPEVKYIGEILSYVFAFFPPYNVGQGLLNISQNYFYIYLTGREVSYFEWQVTGKNICFMFGQFVGFFGMVLLSEYKTDVRAHLIFPFIMWLKGRRGRGEEERNRVQGEEGEGEEEGGEWTENEDEDGFVSTDDDVERESAEVDSIVKGITGERIEDYSLLLHHVKKNYDEYSICRPKKRAVRDLSLKLRQGDKFGFLGVNGAGKSTSLNMITGR